MEAQAGTWLEIDLRGEPIAGCLHEGDLPPQPFSGWLELVTVLEDARERQADAAPRGEDPA